MRRKQKPSLNFSDHFPPRPKGSRVPAAVPREVIVRPAYNRYESDHCIPLRNPTSVLIGTGIADLLNSVALVVAGRSSDAKQVAMRCRSLLARCNYFAVMEALEEYADNEDIRYVRDVLASTEDVKCSDCAAVIPPMSDHVCDPVMRRDEARRAADKDAQFATLMNPIIGARRKR